MSSRLRRVLGHFVLDEDRLAPNAVSGEQKEAQENPAKSYAPRQIGLTKPLPRDGVQIKDSGLVVSKLNQYPLARLQDTYKNLPVYENQHTRTKESVYFGTQSGARRDQRVAWKSDPAELKPRFGSVINDNEFVMVDIVRYAGGPTEAVSFTRGGPRKQIIFAPGSVRAAVVTVGGLCPGLNDVVEELFNCLYYNYGMDVVYGIKNGFRGFHEAKFLPWQILRPSDVEGISNFGGSILGSARGGFDLQKIMSALEHHAINQLYIIGGDGTHRGADLIAAEALKRGLKLCVVGIPKTIDNDVGIIDKSFGFDTAVAEARKAITSAVVEARCSPGGIGIVKLMGRLSGFISSHAVLASRMVDCCLIPEVPFPLEGDCGLLAHTERVLKAQGYAVIVVAEGAGEHLMKDQPDLGVDAGGNKILNDIGKVLSKKLKDHFKKLGEEISIKYHDPSYMIRSVPANASDSILCLLLAQNAVHGAMAGFTAFTSGIVNNRSVLIPIHILTEGSPSYVSPAGRTWERVTSLTHQPSWI